MDNTAELNVKELDSKITELLSQRNVYLASVYRERYARKYFKTVARHGSEKQTDLYFCTGVGDDARISGSRFSVHQNGGCVQTMFSDDYVPPLDLLATHWELAKELTQEEFAAEMNHYLGYLGLCNNIFVKAMANHA